MEAAATAADAAVTAEARKAGLGTVSAGGTKALRAAKAEIANLRN